MPREDIAHDIDQTTDVLTDDLLKIIAYQKTLLAIGSETEVSEMSYGYLIEKVEYWLGYVDAWRLLKYSLDWLTRHLRVTSSGLAESMKYQSDKAILLSLDEINNDISRFIRNKSANSLQQRQILESDQSEDVGMKDFKWLAIRYFYQSLVDFVSIKDGLFKLYRQIFDLYVEKTHQQIDDYENLKSELGAYKNLVKKIGKVLKLINENRKNSDSQEIDIVERLQKQDIQDSWAIHLVQNLVS